MKSKNKRPYGEFYALLRQLPNYNADYHEAIKEGVICDFTQRKRGAASCSLSGLNAMEYDALIKEMRQMVARYAKPEKIVEDNTRRRFIHKIFLKFSEMGVYTVNGYDEINSHIRSLKGFGGRIIPEYKTNELEGLFRAVCNYVDSRKEKQKKITAIARLN